MGGIGQWSFNNLHTSDKFLAPKMYETCGKKRNFSGKNCTKTVQLQTIDTKKIQFMVLLYIKEYKLYYKLQAIFADLRISFGGS